MNLDSPSFLYSFGVSKIKNCGFWEPWAFPLVPNIIVVKTFWVFGKWKLLVLHEAAQFYGAIGSQTPADPNSDFLLLCTMYSMVIYGTTNAVYGTTNAHAGVGIGMKRGGSKLW